MPSIATQCAAQFEPFAWSLTREQIGQDLRERYAVAQELPPKLLAVVSKLAALERKPRLRGLVRKLDAIEGSYLLRYAPSVEPRSAKAFDDWLLCT